MTPSLSSLSRSPIPFENDPNDIQIDEESCEHFSDALDDESSHNGNDFGELGDTQERSEHDQNPQASVGTPEKTDYNTLSIPLETVSTAADRNQDHLRRYEASVFAMKQLSKVVNLSWDITC